MYINDSNLFIEISNITNALVVINARLKQKIEDGVWQMANDAVEDDEKWEWDIDMLNEIMAFIKKEHPEMTYKDEISPQKIMMNQVGEFFRLLNILGKNPLTR
jgi:hypothetical protein